MKKEIIILEAISGVAILLLIKNRLSKTKKIFNKSRSFLDFRYKVKKANMILPYSNRQLKNIYYILKNK